MSVMEVASTLEKFFRDIPFATTSSLSASPAVAYNLLRGKVTEYNVSFKFEHISPYDIKIFKSLESKKTGIFKSGNKIGSSNYRSISILPSWENSQKEEEDICSRKCEHDRTLNLDVSGIDVYFYDFSRNDVQTFKIDNAAKKILAIKGLDKTRKFVIFVGGYQSNNNNKTEERVRDTFRKFPNSYLIILDHSPYTNDLRGLLKGYQQSVRYVYYIGGALAQMLTGLKHGRISPKNMHCIGFSLGSQILGTTGEIFTQNTGTKIARVTALDPAGPCFSNSFIHNQIRSGVADYVEVYHCNAGGLGTSSVLGDIDFFVNRKGQSQPNCKTPLLPGFINSPKAAKCNHRTCVDIWTATVSNPNWYLAWKCDSYRMFKKGNCARNDVTIAGFWNPGNATGVYYFSTDGYDVKYNSIIKSNQIKSN